MAEDAVKKAVWEGREARRRKGLLLLGEGVPRNGVDGAEAAFLGSGCGAADFSFGGCRVAGCAAALM